MNGCARFDEPLALSVSEDLPEAVARGLRQHLDVCADCRARQAAYRADAAWLRTGRRRLGDSELLETLQRRLLVAAAAERPRPWFSALLRRWWDQVPHEMWLRSGHQALAAGLGLALMVAAVGALERPLGTNHFQLSRELGPTSAALARRPPAGSLHAELEHDPSELEVETAPADDDEPEAESGDDEPVAQDDPEMASADRLSDAARGLRIELQTPDPDVRIIWFAQAGAPR